MMLVGLVNSTATFDLAMILSRASMRSPGDPCRYDALYRRRRHRAHRGRVEIA